MSKNTQTTQRAYMHKIIPYRYCYEEGGLIETEQGLFTRTYEVIPPGEEVKGSYNSKMTRILTEIILQGLAEKFSFQFTLHNCHMDKEEYLAQIMMREKGEEDGYGQFRKLYNKVLSDNCDIGHNNFFRTVYLTLSIRADMPDVGCGYMGGEPYDEIAAILVKADGEAQERVDTAKSFLDVGEMTEEIWERFVKAAYVYPDGRIEIQWNFGDEME